MRPASHDGTNIVFPVDTGRVEEEPSKKTDRLFVFKLSTTPICLPVSAPDP